jgi:hypothetical protein
LEKRELSLANSEITHSVPDKRSDLDQANPALREPVRCAGLIHFGSQSGRQMGDNSLDIVNTLAFLEYYNERKETWSNLMDKAQSNS